ncbi:MAG: pro-sigmaK processing inhibitor BofA family protein [Defluviitaleaceae bacterium]|nr:pro-sigmaK processing inhibitor BofA family protein [Defluviitaleaceae bacterium]
MEFLQNLDSQGIIWIAIGVLILLGLLVVNNKLRKVAGFAVRAILGVAAVAVINMTLGGFGVAVGINFLTIAVVAFLGLPGIGMLYGLSFFI